MELMNSKNLDIIIRNSLLEDYINNEKEKLKQEVKTNLDPIKDAPSIINFRSKELYDKYLDCENDFDIIKANIIIKAIINKEELDKIIEDTYLKYDKSSINEIKDLIKEQVSDLPYIDYENFKVYIPFFNKATNFVYSVENEKKKEFPYIDLTKKYEPFLVEPFETYSVDLFNSLYKI